MSWLWVESNLGPRLTLAVGSKLNLYAWGVGGPRFIGVGWAGDFEV